MGTNRRKAVKDRKKHREQVEKWKAKRRAERTKEVADRLLGKKRIVGIDHAWRGHDDRMAYSFFCKDHAPTT